MRRYRALPKSFPTSAGFQDVECANAPKWHAAWPHCTGLCSHEPALTCECSRASLLMEASNTLTVFQTIAVAEPQFDRGAVLIAEPS